MKKKESRKDKIVKAAIKCFVSFGVAETTMSQVAHLAKVDQPLIHYYFPSTEILYQDVFKVVLESLREASLEPLAATAQDPVKSLAAYIRAPFLWAAREPGLFSIWMYFYYLASFNPTFYKLNFQIRHTGRERIAAILYSGIEEKVFHVPARNTVREMALIIQGLITGNAILFGTEGNQDKKIIDATVKSILGTLSAK
jgi:AcrR family transcriptional regulator